MLDYLFDLIKSAANSQMSSAVVLAWLLGTGSYLARSVPGAIWKFISDRCTISFNYRNFVKDYRSVYMYSLVSWFYSEFGIFKNTASVYGTSTSSCFFQPNYLSESKYILSKGGVYWFFFNGKLGKIKKVQLDSSGVDFEKEELWITIYFGTVADMEAVKKWVSEKEKELSKDIMKDKVNIWSHSHGDCSIANVYKRSKESLVLNTSTYGHCSTGAILDDIKKFVLNKETLLRKSIAFKKTILLHGKPGTGKTSLVNLIAGDLNCRVDSFNSVQSFSKWVGERDDSEFAIALLDEVDTYKESTGTEKNSSGRNNKGELLLALDGIASLNSCIVILCTNNFNDIDPALLRPGRVDDIIEVLFWGIEDLNEYLKFILDQELSFDIEQWKHLDGLIQPARVYSIVAHAVQNSVSDPLVVSDSILSYFKEIENKLIKEN